MNTQIPYSFSKHSIKRFLERFWRELTADTRQRMGVKGYLEYAISNATEEKSFLNNTSYMTYVYEKYGYKKYNCLCYNNMLFLIVDNVVITMLKVDCFPIKINKKFKSMAKTENFQTDQINPKLEKMIMNGNKGFTI